MPHLGRPPGWGFQFEWEPAYPLPTPVLNSGDPEDRGEGKGGGGETAVLSEGRRWSQVRLRTGFPWWGRIGLGSGESLNS